SGNPATCYLHHHAVAGRSLSAFALQGRLRREIRLLPSSLRFGRRRRIISALAKGVNPGRFCYISGMADPTPAEIVHQRLRAFLLFLKPRMLQDNVDQDRLDQLRRLSDVRVRKFAVTKPQITGADLCGLLADPRTGRFDDLSDEAGILKKGHFAAVLPTL